MFSSRPRNLEQFLRLISEEYQNARKPILASPEIERGRSRTISGISEDLFAELMKNVLNDERLHFFIDQPIRIERKTFYPDLVIAKKEDDINYNVVYMLDLKMDVGYHRNTVKGQNTHSTYLDKASDLTRLCQSFKDAKIGEGKCGTLKSTKAGKDAKRFVFTISPKASYDMVVITNQNAGSKPLSEELLAFSNDPQKNIWVLATGEHPNEYHKPEVKENLQDFNVLIDKIQKVIN